MALTDDLITRVNALRDLASEIMTAESLTATVASFDDDSVLTLMKATTELGNAVEGIRLATAGVIGARSSRAAGHSGMAQSRGHRNATSLLQQVTGSSRGEAARQLRVGESLYEEATPVAVSPQQHVDAATPKVWHAPLKAGLLSGRITTGQHDAIRRGLGEPPVVTESDGTSPAALEAWSVAAEQLLEEAQDVSVEELARHARAIRDLLDPEGAEARYLARFEARSFRMWTDAAGLTRGAFTFDDESAAWLRSVIDTALRPRRGGPRFVDPQQKQQASELEADTRTNDQLAHDLLIDVLKAGTLAEAETVLGARQAGVRVVQVVDREVYEREVYEHAQQTPGIITRLEDDGTILPEAVAEQQRCNTGVVPVVADRDGNPLNVGREQRLYTPKQRIVLAIRDGGCRWNGCDRPPSYCEAHHIDEWVADSGRTDVDRGILLCRFHHVQLHHSGWKITRDGTGVFLLHPPPGRNRTPIPLRVPLPLRYAWQHVTPPPNRFRAVA